MRSFTDELAALRKRLAEAEVYLDLDGKRARVAELESEIARLDLWDDQDNARAVTTEYGRLGDDVSMLEGLESRIDDAETLYAMAVEEDDDSQEAEIASEVAAIERELDSLELRSLFMGEYDERDAVCELHAGEGGTDAQDWTEMLLRMYARWAERHGLDFELDEVSAGQEAGILSATVIVKGRYAYGLLCAERGVHRLYRNSPFDAQHRRQTSYGAVDVTPFFEEIGDDEVDIDEKDLRIDVYRSSGAGGQHVNVTDSAVRITHLPTGIVVSCQNERSQMQNKARAMQVLRAKLLDRARQERQAELNAISGPRGQVSRGGAFIRQYVMHPYQKVKDERTDYESGNITAVLDGEIQDFMEAWLRWRRANEG